MHKNAQTAYVPDIKDFDIASGIDPAKDHLIITDENGSHEPGRRISLVETMQLMTGKQETSKLLVQWKIGNTRSVAIETDDVAGVLRNMKTALTRPYAHTALNGHDFELVCREKKRQVFLGDNEQLLPN